MSEDETMRWVRQLNDLARRLDENAGALNPSAWPVLLKADTDQWKQLAKAGPRS